MSILTVGEYVRIRKYDSHEVNFYTKQTLFNENTKPVVFLTNNFKFQLETIY